MTQSSSYESTTFPYDEVQPNTHPFSTRDLIWVNYQVVSPLFQPIFLPFSYFNSARHISVIELYLEPIFWVCFTVDRKLTYSFLAIDFLAFSNNVDFNIYLFIEIKFLWLYRKYTSLNRGLTKKSLTYIKIFIINFISNFDF